MMSSAITGIFVIQSFIYQTVANKYSISVSTTQFITEIQHLRWSDDQKQRLVLNWGLLRIRAQFIVKKSMEKHTLF